MCVPFAPGADDKMQVNLFGLNDQTIGADLDEGFRRKVGGSSVISIAAVKAPQFSAHRLRSLR